MDWKKFFAYLTTAGKIISFASLVLSVTIKVRTLMGVNNKKEDIEESETENENKDS